MQAQPLPPEPTDRLYAALKHAKNFFAQELFDGELGPCLLTVQRNRGMCAYFAAHRWKDIERKSDDTLVHEIAMNPEFFASQGLLNILSSLVHEQAHQWQFEHGKPSRRSYHNREFSQIMERVGLITSTTGRPDGKRVGQRVSHYALRSGRFFAAAKAFIEGGFHLPLVDRFAIHSSPLYIDGESEVILLDEDCTSGGTRAGEAPPGQPPSDRKRRKQPPPDSDPQLDTPLGAGDVEDVLVRPVKRPEKSPASAKNKRRFSCPSCGAKAWGRPTLLIGCLVCDEPMVEG